jgi:enamine deaminase RidA (YjgF/YER057c/UK114 family)
VVVNLQVLSHERPVEVTGAIKCVQYPCQQLRGRHGNSVLAGGRIVASWAAIAHSLCRVRQQISSGSPFEPTFGYSRAVRDGHLVFVSATAAIWPDGHVDPDAGVQARRSLEIIEEALREAGATLRDVVRTRVFLVDAAHSDAVGQVHGEVFGEIRPATGFIIVDGFLDPRWLVEIEADAVVGG